MKSATSPRSRCRSPFLSTHHERGSIILTSNKRFSDWGELIGDDTLAAAILDRLLHHATTISINGPSYRLKEKRRAAILDPAKRKGGDAA